MPRPDRDFNPDSFYHVTPRGNNGRSICRDVWDYAVLTTMLERVVRTYGLVLYAHCLMGNHFHLVVNAPAGGLSEAMRELIGGYARRTNRRYDSTGHVFRNRFRAKEVESDAHLLEACLYVVLNPVRPGMVPTSEGLGLVELRRMLGAGTRLSVRRGEGVPAALRPSARRRAARVPAPRRGCPFEPRPGVRHRYGSVTSPGPRASGQAPDRG